MVAEDTPLSSLLIICSLASPVPTQRAPLVFTIGARLSHGQLHSTRQYSTFIDRNATHVGQRNRSIWKADFSASHECAPSANGHIHYAREAVHLDRTEPGKAQSMGTTRPTKEVTVTGCRTRPPVRLLRTVSSNHGLFGIAPFVVGAVVHGGVKAQVTRQQIDIGSL